MTSTQTGGRAAALILLASTPLAGCVAGHQFSIAMASPGADPGAAQTVLVLGDGDPGATEVASPNEGLAPTSSLSTSLGLATTSQAAATRARLPATPSQTGALTASMTAATQPGAAATGLAQASIPSPTVTPVLGVSTPPVQVVVGAAPVQVTATGPALQVATSPQASQVAVTTPGVQVGLGGSAAAVAIAASTAAVATGPTGVQAGLSAPVAATSASLAAGSGGVTAQASTPLAVASVAASPAKGLQLGATSPAFTLVTGTLASSTAPFQATLAGVTSAVGLAAPSPRASTPTASLLKTLTGSPAKKLKRG